MPYLIIEPFLLWFLSYDCFRRLQNADYRPARGYFRLLYSPYFVALALLQVLSVLVQIYALPRYVTDICCAVIGVVFACIPHKVRFKFTKRVIRMLCVQLAVLIGISFASIITYAVAALPFITLVSLVLCMPIDFAVARYYIRKARHKLENSNVTVIAVTGSYGKTSVKDMLCSLLDDSACASGSCNTPLGIAAYINKTDFYYVKYLVLEFGARKRGDIAELCRLYKPKYGIVTGVCAQHLSTFKSLDNVITAKRELVECLPENGVCVLNYADEIAAGFVNAGECRKQLSNDDVSVQTNKITVDGTELSVSYRKTVKSVRLPQITAYTADTFLMCLKMCLTVGQSFTKTLQRAVNVRQTPHRMEISKAQNCYIIDDGYNGNIVGVTSMAKTLNLFDRHKTVITQGLVECGSKRKELNIQCGRILGEACDVAIVLGANAKFLEKGLKQTDCTVFRVKNLKQAVAQAQGYLNGPDNSILLFQNDLPDNL